MTKKSVKLLSMAVAILLLLASFSGCGDKSDSSANDTTAAGTTQAAESASEAASEKPASNELEWKADTSPIKFTAFMNYNPNPWDGWGTDPVSQEITKRTGVTVEVTTATTNDSQQLNALIASGDLPDFIIYDKDNPARTLLWKQGFALPLNKLMDEHAPNMRSILPKDEDKFYTESDGNQYIFVGYYSDIDRIAQLKGTQQCFGALAMNMPMYKQLGEPKYTTLDEYKQVLLQAKEKFPDVTFLAYDQKAAFPQDTQRSMAQLINRIYGGTNVKAVGADGTVHLNFRDETYLKALKFINGLYRDKLFSAENFTITTEEQYSQTVKNQKIFSYWGQAFDLYKFDMTENGPYKAVEPPQEPGIPLKLMSVVTGIGGWPAVSITKSCQNPARAIQYLEFLMSDEGQMLTYHGIEGKDYTIVDDMPKNSEEKDKQWNSNFSEMQKKMGIINYQVSWIPSNWADMLYYYWLNESKPAYKSDLGINNKFASNERINELINVASDSEEKVIETKVFDLWKTMLPKMYLATSEDKCVEAYNEFIAKAEKLGLQKLEKAYTTDYQKWAQMIGQ